MYKLLQIGKEYALVVYKEFGIVYDYGIKVKTTGKEKIYMVNHQKLMELDDAGLLDESGVIYQ